MAKPFVYNFWSTLSDWGALLNSPFSPQQFEGIRMRLMVEMKAYGFSHYVQQMKDIMAQIDTVVENEAYLADDSYWEKNVPGFDTTYWQKESPWLSRLYQFKRGVRLFTVQPTGLSTLTTMFLNDQDIRKFVGNQSFYTAQQIILFNALILTYYTNDSRLWPIHLNMDYTFQTRRPKNVDFSTRVLQSSLAGSGTFILKILQQINTANENTISGGASVADLAKDVFDNVPALTPEEQDYLKRNLSLRPEWIQNMDPNLLGSASIAEAHLTDDGKGLEGVIKFIKPIYAYFYLCEINFLLTTTWKQLAETARTMPGIDPALQTMYIRQTRQVLMYFIQEFAKEFFYEQEFINTTKGFEAYNKQATHVRSVMVLDHGLEPFPALVVQRVTGKTLDKILNHDTVRPSPEVMSRMYSGVTQIAEVWFKNTLWGNGFFHADLHPGNLMMTEDGLIYIIDYGSCGDLTTGQQCKLITGMILSGSIEAAKDDPVKLTQLVTQFTRSLMEVCQVGLGEIKGQALSDLVQKIIADRHPRHGYTFGGLFLTFIANATTIGKCTHGNVLLFGRASAYLGSMFAKIESVCNDPQKCPTFLVDGIVKSNLIRHPMQLAYFYWWGTVC